MVGSAISPVPDFLNDHGRVSGGSAGGPIEADPPALHVGANTIGCHVAVHTRDGESIPSEIRQDGQHVAASATSPGADRCLRVGADDQIEGYQSRPEDLWSGDGGHRAGRWCTDPAPSVRHDRPPGHRGDSRCMIST